MINDCRMTMALLLIWSVTAVVLLVLLTSFLVPFVLALLTILRRWIKRRQTRTALRDDNKATDAGNGNCQSSSSSSSSPHLLDNHTNDFDPARSSSSSSSSWSSSSSSFLSSILVGRVSHTRHHPKRHSFQYPLFMFGLDLGRDVEENHLFDDHLWPLSLIMSFRTHDHLKNAEGIKVTIEQEESIVVNEEKGVRSCNKEPTTTIHRLSQRICNLVSERTQGQFQPTPETHFIYLVTHLSYYGYCFNPISFYYVVDKNHQSSSQQEQQETNKKNAFVAEVSNTPWNEMYAYVLHPNSSDHVQAMRRSKSATSYLHPKCFHVSPFMEMSYDYDWIVDDWSPQHTRVVITMRNNNTTTSSGDNKNNQKNNTNSHDDDAMRKQPPLPSVQFTATVEIDALGLDPFTLAWQLARYPTYCFIVQVWIHYEALWLFLKGISLKPHPHGTKTTLGRILGGIVKPIMALKDHLSGGGSTCKGVLNAKTKES